MNRLIRYAIWLCFIYFLGCTAAAIYLSDVTMHPYRRPIPVGAEDEMRHSAAQLNSQLTDVQIESDDHLPLLAWLIQPQRGNRDAVILLHGLGDNRLGTAGYAQMLLAHGYAVLMPDARAHGQSSGTLTTYGLLERGDIQRWFEWLSTANHPRCIYGIGESMGAAQLLQALDVEPNFCAVIAESSFSSFREIAYDRMGQYVNSGAWVGRDLLRTTIDIAFMIVRSRQGIDLDQASPADVVARTHVPVLLIHGAIDSNIPVRHSRLIVASNPKVELWEVPGADHGGAISVARPEFEKRMLAWFAAHQYPAGKAEVRAVATN